MCGIAGIADLSGATVIEPRRLAAMAAILGHRGPDQAGVYVDDFVGLAHRRLSIIDLGGGAQPLCNEDRSVWITYNGEVYNYRELRRRLVAHGHRFATATDTEVIVHLYEERGSACVEELNGQFALAIWDSRARRLFLARDRMGIRPLHYAWRGKKLVFGSEVKVLFAGTDMPRRFDLRALVQIGTLWSTIPGRTAFEGVRELPAGHGMVVDEGGHSLWRYWDVPFGSRGAWLSEPPGAIAGRVRELLADAVRIRLRADVPVGAYVSGGLDSSAVAALAAPRVRPELTTFGIRFDEELFDEGEPQRRMVRWLGSRHSEMHVETPAIAEWFPRALWHIEKPVLRTAPVPLFLLSRVVREAGMKVVLTGEGADEVFGGYNIFRETLVRRFWARRPDSGVRGRLAEQLYPNIFHNPRMKRMLLSFVGRHLAGGNDPLYSHRLRWETTAKVLELLEPGVMETMRGYDPTEELRERLPHDFGSWDALSKAQYLEMGCFLGTYLLSSQGDRVAMAHSVEMRLPFLDHRLVEYAARIPATWKVLGLSEKHILKRSLARVLPAEITQRRKFPFRAPIARALVNGERAAAMLCDDSLRRAEVFDVAKVSHLVRRIRARGDAGEVDSMALAGIVSTLALHDQFIRRFTVPEAVPIRQLAVMVDRRTTHEGEPPGVVHTSRREAG
jgi:asparagine synthase (glutamine-hydrolysing)